MLVCCKLLFRYEKREALKARFEIQMKLHRQKKHDKKKLREKKLKQSLKDGRRKPQDRIKTNHHKRSQAMTEYKANRSAGTYIAFVSGMVVFEES